MLNLQYVGDTTKYPVNFRKISDHVVEVTGRLPVKPGGFTLSRLKEDEWRPDYSRFTTVYREIAGGVQFSDDGSVYIAPPEPEPKPEPDPYVPTLEELRTQKKQEIEWMHQTAIAEGIDVGLSTGEQHFPLRQEEITFLMGKKIELESGVKEVAYQDANNHCIFLSNEDMQTIIMAAFSFVNVKTSYRNNLYEWLDKCQTAEEIKAITYGMLIPVEYQSEVYKRYLANDEGVNDETVS